MSTVTLCGDVRAFESVVRCECGRYRGAERPHAFRFTPVAAKEVTDYVAQVCGGCDRVKSKCTCSDGECG